MQTQTYYDVSAHKNNFNNTCKSIKSDQKVIFIREF